jgi:FkbM family methyltransferase
MVRSVRKRIRRLRKKRLHGRETRRVGKVVFEFDYDFSPAYKDMRVGGYADGVAKVMGEYLHAGSRFVDVGANVGYVSALALSRVGPSGEVHGFEPVPEYCRRLRRLAELNPRYRLVVNNVALGDEQGTKAIRVSKGDNIGWNTLVPGFLTDSDQVRDELDVSVIRLDGHLKEHGIRDIALHKIDTEGYEYPVLKGMSSYLEHSRNRPPILCEIAPTAYDSLGLTLVEFAGFMGDLGYDARDVSSGHKPIDIRRLTSTTDVLFVRE